MRLGIGLGLFKQAAVSVGVRLFSAYKSRVIADGGTVEADNCAINALNNGLFQRASLLIIPSGYKGGKAYAEIPTNGNGDLTWTRASDAWRTNADGLIQRVPWNLASYSEAFDNAAWSLDGVTISANQIASPTGTTTADLMTSNGTGQQRIFQVYTVSANSPYTISIYVKQGTTSTIQIVMPYVGAGPTFTFSTATFNTVSGWTSSVETLANGWYRISVTNTPTTTQAGFQLALPSNGSTVYLWGAQFNQGSSAQTYFPTTDRLNVPRLSYMYGSCPALLLEPQRTNLCLYSQTFGDSSWTALNSTKVSTNNTDPSATNTALNVTWVTGGSKYFYRTQTGLTIGTTYTITFYVKSSNASKFRIYGESLGFTSSNFTTTSDFQRFQLTYTATVTSGTFGLQSASDNTAADLIVAFAQLEAGAYPTTYIPTTTASATRIADSFSRSNIYTNGLITSSGGTWFVELRGNVVYGARDGNEGIGVGDTTALTTNSLRLFVNTSGTVQVVKYVSSTLTTLISTSTSTVKIAIKWNGTSADVFINGSKVVTATAFTTKNMEWLTGNAGVPFFIQSMALYPTPLSDTDCTTITTL